ncbi:unnamed protein product [Didymodactylos carnosus]|uniref:Uncharacterized protein n=1 Tax=Didymodactylos carnosus TaxID=1234261 RepID=A0A813YH34_9BILA|nr:unnamed protein product [Didymodactylos carnosus]CAF0884126.1 unnamed protein product [Didymodactylos carnosus]CAF3541802.1 unnamed protein product [Didymodactylos carnosus]CAF3669694.1 unnamed protein product [Didymodactylos carnosus]
MPMPYPQVLPPAAPMPQVIVQPYPVHRPHRTRRIRLVRRHHHRRPRVRIIDSRSYSTGSSCSSYRHCSRSHSHHSKQCQQPIILLPIQIQQQPTSIQQQPLALAQPSRAHQQIVLPPIQIQGVAGQHGQPLVLPSIQLNSSILNNGTNQNPIIVNATPVGASLQQSFSMPQIPPIQISTTAQPQQIQLVHTSSPLQYVTNPAPVGIHSRPANISVNNSNKQQQKIRSSASSTRLRR